MPKIVLTRRDFLKLSAATAVIAGTIGVDELIFLRKNKTELSIPNTPQLEERYFVCRICGGGCVLKGYLTPEGRLAKIEGDKNDWVSHGTPCVKGKTVLRMLYDPDRLKKPLKRTNPEIGFERGPNGELIGVKDPGWIEADWDEVLEEIADKMAEAIRTWGPQSIVFIGHGKGSALAKLIGTPNIVKHHSTCHSTWDVTLKPMYGGVPNSDMRNSKLILAFGFDQGAGKSKNPFAWLFAYAKKNGAKIIVFEPRLSETASKATGWIPIKPGTDLAVLLAMINVIINEGLYDEEFLSKYTNAPLLMDPETYQYIKDEDGNFLVYDTIKGQIVPLDSALSPQLEWEGNYNDTYVKTAFKILTERVQEYTPEWAESISGVPAEKIKQIAIEFATTKPASIPHWKRSGGTGPNRGQGVESYKAVGILMALTGNIEKPGGWLYNRNAKFVSKAISKTPKKTFADLYPIPEEYQGKTIDEKEKFPLYKKNTKEGAYQKVWYNILNDYPYPVKVVIVWGQGLQAVLDYDLVERAINHVVYDNNGIVVNVNIYPDEMAALANIVLPEKFFLEGGANIGFSKSFDITTRINWVDGIEPLYPDAKSESWIVKQLAYKIAERLGISKTELENDYFSEYFLVSGQEKLEKMVEKYNEKTGANITLDDLKREKVISIEWKPKDLTSLETPSGRIEILPTELAEYGYDPLPKWSPGFTYDESSLADNELVMVSTVFAMNRHSKTVNNDWLRYFLAKHHADKVWIHPDTASKLGLKEGDKVIISYKRSFDPEYTIHTPKFKVLAKVHITEGVRPDIIVVPHGTGQLSRFMASYGFGPLGGDGVVKSIELDYNDPSASSRDLDIIVEVRRYG
ncbi:MAG: molybdopterin-dependent oxidoreductase [Desulfurococcales archaeon]|nr:molybdopterin-dependent oxidoreductase [Desulfurococcales archaeon]